MDQQLGTQAGYDPVSPPDWTAVADKLSRKQKKGKSLLREYLETILIALLAAVLLRLFVVSAYHVTSGSMEDTLLAGDYIFVSKLAYEYSPPKIGDVIVFSNPYDPGKDYIKRIVAVGGQTVEVVDKVLVVDGQISPIPESSKNIDSRVIPAELSPRDNFGPLVVPEGQYFVLGDNRDDSQDSRFWGCLDKSNIKGKALFIYYSHVPDPNAPQWKAPYILEFFQILFHNIGAFFSSSRFDRVGRTF